MTLQSRSRGSSARLPHLVARFVDVEVQVAVEEVALNELLQPQLLQPNGYQGHAVALELVFYSAG